MQDLIVVTGAAGFIGRNVVQALNDRGQTKLWLIDDLGTDEKWKNLRGLRFEDIHSPSDFLNMIGNDQLPAVQSIIHLGACSATTERDADFLLRNNYRYTRQLCEWALPRGVRFVYASSAATYGQGELGFSDDDSITPRLRPMNMYGYSKHLFDLWALSSGAFSQIAGLKYFNVFGPYEDHKGEMRSVVHKSYQQILRDGTVQLFRSNDPQFADGEQKRDFVFVRDAVDVTLFFVDHPEISGLFNCGSGTARTWLDLTTALFTALGRPPQIEFIEMPETLRHKYQNFTQADAHKLHRAGYSQPFISLEEGVRRYVQDYLQLVN